MVDSKVVLTGQTLAYTLYCIVMILLVLWLSIKITGKGKGLAVKPAVFYTFVGFLTVLGVSLHIITYHTIPWAEMDLNRGDYKADKTFVITVKDHQFTLPAENACNYKTGPFLFSSLSSYWRINRCILIYL